jgi:hypothetical protein
VVDYERICYIVPLFKANVSEIATLKVPIANPQQFWPDGRIIHLVNNVKMRRKKRKKKRRKKRNFIIKYT